MGAVPRVAFTLGLGTLGGAVLAYLGMPGGWLAGSMLAVAIASLATLPVRVPGLLRTVAFVLVGTSMGAAVTPETLHQMAQWPGSLVLLAVSVTATITLLTYYLERVRGWDHSTARFTSVPGALSYVLIIAASRNADVPRIAFAQTLRLMVLVLIVPLLVNRFGGATAVLPGRGDIGPPLVELALMLLACGLGATLLIRARVPGGPLLGAMITSALLHGSGLATAKLPQPLLVTSFIITGCVIGERFKGTRFAVIAATVRGAVESITLAVVLALGFSWTGHLLLGIPVGQLFLAYAPGGLEAMAIMAFVLDLDPAFVSAHHLARFVALSLLAPLWMPRRPRD